MEICPRNHSLINQEYSWEKDSLKPGKYSLNFLGPTSIQSSKHDWNENHKPVEKSTIKPFKLKS